MKQNNYIISLIFKYLFQLSFNIFIIHSKNFKEIININKYFMLKKIYMNII